MVLSHVAPVGRSCGRSIGRSIGRSCGRNSCTRGHWDQAVSAKCEIGALLFGLSVLMPMPMPMPACVCALASSVAPADTPQMHQITIIMSSAEMLLGYGGCVGLGVVWTGHGNGLTERPSRLHADCFQRCASTFFFGTSPKIAWCLYPRRAAAPHLPVVPAHTGG